MKTTDGGKRLALFDFDGTLTRNDTLIDFMKYHFGKQFYFKLIPLIPILGFHLLGLVSGLRTKEALLTKFLKNKPLIDFDKLCAEYAENRIPQVLRQEAKEVLEQFRKEGADIYVVSASPQNWIIPWCRELSMGCIASNLEVVDGCLTGKLEGPNCNGVEKVRRIKAEIDLSEYSEIFAFGNSKGDLPMLGLAGKNGYYQSFDLKI